MFSLYFQRNLPYKQASKHVWIEANGCGLFVLWLCHFPDRSCCQNPPTFQWKKQIIMFIELIAAKGCYETFWGILSVLYAPFTNMSGFFSFIWVLEIKTQIFMIMCQAVYLPSHLHNLPVFFSFFIITFISKLLIIIKRWFL